MPLSTRPGTIIGYRADGRPIRLFGGGSGDEGGTGGDTGAGAGGDGQQGGQGSEGGTGGTGAEGQQQRTEGQQGGKYAHITDPAELRALAERLDREAAGADGKARDNARAKAAQEAAQQVRDEVAKALGLTTDKADPAQLQSEMAQLRATNMERDRELAVYRAALKPGTGVDVGRLTDSRSFMDAVKRSITDPTRRRHTDEARRAHQAGGSIRSVTQSAPGGAGWQVEHPGGAGDHGNPDTSKLQGTDLLAAGYARNATNR